MQQLWPTWSASLGLAQRHCSTFLIQRRLPRPAGHSPGTTRPVGRLAGVDNLLNLVNTTYSRCT